MLKQLFSTALSSEQVIAMVNDIAENPIPTNYNVTFADTESADVTGSSDKEFVVGDKLVIFSHPDVSEEEIKKAIVSGTKLIKLVLEFQSRKYRDKHYNMGLRLFSYTINAVERTDVEGEIVFDVPDGITIYTDLHLPKYGTDDLIFKFTSFWGGNTKYYGKNNDYFKLEYKYVNLLAFKFDELKGTPFEVLEVLYLYKYRKNLDLMLREDFLIVMRDIAYKIMQYDGMVLELLSKIYQDLLYDIELKANKNTKKYERVLEGMVEVKKSYGTQLIDDAKAEGEAIGEAKGEMRTKLKLASDFLENNSIEFVSKSFKLPMEYVQALENGYTVESIVEKHFEFGV